MTRGKAALGLGVLALVAAGLVWLRAPGDVTPSPRDRLARTPAARPDGPAVTPLEPPPAAADSESEPPAVEAPPRILYLHDIDDIKHEIYLREIDSVDRLHLLDELVQTGDRDTRELWDADWGGVDDWKQEQNGFALQRLDDGSLVFHPDQATMDLYSFTESIERYEYDPLRHEFTSEVDYYGKPIRKVLKFIKDDTLVMMVISGDKVDLNIYDKHDERE